MALNHQPRGSWINNSTVESDEMKLLNLEKELCKFTQFESIQHVEEEDPHCLVSIFSGCLDFYDFHLH